VYETFFGLREHPFGLSPNPKFLYLSPRQREALSNLRYGTTTARGLTLLTGDAGTGKTTLLQVALSEVDPSTSEVVLLSNPTLTRDEFYEYLGREFKIDGDTKPKFLAALEAKLHERLARGHLTALVLDEAQSLSFELLEEVRLLSNIETPTTKLLNVVLIGQPELADRLNDSALRQLKQRISLRCELLPMDLRETAAYIANRLRVAGGSPAHIFTREAIQVIYGASKGIARTVSVLCDNALLTGFAAGEHPVTARLVEEVCRDFDVVAPVITGSDTPAKTDAESASSPDKAASSTEGSKGTPSLLLSFTRPVRFGKVKGESQ